VAREFDLIVFGATGFTGRHVAAYLSARAGEAGLTWAAAARDGERAARALEQVGAKPDALITADIGDPASLNTMAARGRYVLDLVGPYALYGRPVIEACIAQETGYLDLTGEIPFVREILLDLDADARAAGVKVIQVSGFEALPADLLVRMAAETASERHGEPLVTADLAVSTKMPPGIPRLSDGISGGTFQSVVALTGREDAASVTDSAALIDDPALARRVRSLSPIALAPRPGEDGAVVGPMAPAPFINPAVIHRSEELAARAEGRDAHPFRYREGIAFAGSPATLPLRWAVAGTLSATQYAMRALAQAGPSVRQPVARVLGAIGPAAGSGPDEERMQHWHWEMVVRAQTTAGNVVHTRLDADGHPGYLSTARMVGEAGVQLASAGATTDAVGCLTPAAALGTACTPAFASAGVRFSVDP